jgi:hypothetical protein
MATTSNTYTGNGSNKLFSITYPYLDTSDIDVYLNGTLQTITTQYFFANATTIEFVAAPSNGAVILLKRSTDDTDLKTTFFPGSLIRSSDLNDNFDQGLFIAQETTNTATAATTSASNAVTTANNASANASAAVSTANTANSNATAAVSTANTAASNASAAVSTANTASSNASAAVSTANSAAVDAATAISTANGAVTTANGAVTTANNASSTANAAAAAVATVVPYTKVAAVANIPASPTNNQAIEIADSTGIESFSPLSSLPAGYIGSPGLSIRIVYSTSTSSWTFIEYFANDPETRYLKVIGGTMTGALVLPLGAASTPSLTFTGATNTGIFITGGGADELAFATGGTARLTIDSSGNVAVVSGLTQAGNNVVTVGDTGTVTSTMIANGTILNEDINASAAIADTKLATIATAGKVSNSATTATDTNAATAIVARDASGNFTAGTITAALTGNASTATTLATARNIQGVSFDGSAAITVVTAGSGISVTGTAVANTGVLSVNGSAGTITNVAVTNAAQSFSAGQRGSITALTDGATITADLAVANNFSVTLGGNRTLANPSNQTAGQSGTIVITQDGTGSRALYYGSNWKFPGGTPPTLTTAASSVDVIAYYVESATRITARLISDVK